MSLRKVVTGGLLSHVLTKLPGSSGYFLGAVVCYSDSVKEKILGVASESLKKHGAVSEQVALEMAKGACEKLGSDWALSITGIAGPNGGSQDKPVGTVCFALVGPENAKLVVTKQMGATEGREKIQQRAMEFALNFLYEKTIKK